MSKVIEVDNFVKYYDDFEAVSGISFSIDKGEILAILGPNGAGKSTTLKGICCLHEPTWGDIRVGGYSVYTHPEAVKSQIGYLPESAPLYSEMLVYDFLRFVADLRGVKQPHQKTLEVAARCNVVDRLGTPIGELSKGLKQRVGLAQALLGDPDILILDEPTAGLDPNQIAEIRTLIKNIGKEKTVILSTHILSEVESTCDRAIIIHEGKIVADSLVEDLRSMKNKEMEISLEVEGCSEGDLKEAMGEIKTLRKMVVKKNKESLVAKLICDFEEETLRDVYRVVQKKPWVLTHLNREVKSLEEIFRELTHTKENENGTN